MNSDLINISIESQNKQIYLRVDSDLSLVGDTLSSLMLKLESALNLKQNKILLAQPDTIYLDLASLHISQDTVNLFLKTYEKYFHFIKRIKLSFIGCVLLKPAVDNLYFSSVLGENKQLEYICLNLSKFDASAAF